MELGKHVPLPNETQWIRCIVVKNCFRVKRPIYPVYPVYPVEVNTLGDCLRKVRLDRGLSQSDVGRIFNVSKVTISAWELNIYTPTLKYAKSIFAFIGFFPFKDSELSFEKKLYYSRLILGDTQRQAAKIIGCDPSVLRRTERDQGIPRARVLEKIQEYIDAAFATLSKSPY